MADTDPSDRLEDFLVTARSLREYRAFFTLPDDLAGKRILDCPGGAASVTAELRAAGADAVAVDPVYALEPEELERLAGDQIEHSSAYTNAEPDRYDWSFYGGPEGHAAERESSAARFVTHSRQEPERYIAASLPDLPFDGDAFDLALTSHLLFSYADRLDEDFHIASFLELARVAREVRAFPTISYAGEAEDALVEAVMAALTTEGLECRLEPAAFRFQQQSEHMLVVTRRDPGLG